MQRVTRFAGHVPLYFDDLDSGFYVLDFDPGERADKNSYSSTVMLSDGAVNGSDSASPRNVCADVSPLRAFAPLVYRNQSAP